MKMRWFLLLCLTSVVWGSDPEEALQKVQVPLGDYERVPVKYILQKIEKEARDSGENHLLYFKIKQEILGADDKRISVDLTGLNLAEALEAVSAAIDAGLKYSDSQVALVNPADLDPVDADAELSAGDDADDKPSRVGFSDINKALVFIKNGQGRGSGFIAEMNGKTYMFSNQHNFLGATKLGLQTMDGRTLKPKSFEFSRTQDLVRMELSKADVKNLSVLEISDETPNIGQEIAVYGNSAGGGVASELLGDILGVGPSVIEIDAEIVSGNSGSPIIDSSGRVLGVATYITLGRTFDKKDPRYEIFKQSRFKKARRFGVRIPEGGWQEAPLKDYLRQTYIVVDMKNYLDALYILVQHWLENDEFDHEAGRLFSAYAKLGPGSSDAPYTFRDHTTEKSLQMMVGAYRKNHAGIDEDFEDLSRSEQEAIGSRITHLLIKSIRGAEQKLEDTKWASDYLETEAKPLQRVANKLIDIMESKANPYVRYK